MTTPTNAQSVLTQAKGQATVEYILMLSSIVVVILAFFTAFHTHIVRFCFQFVGMLITS